MTLLLLEGFEDDSTLSPGVSYVTAAGPGGRYVGGFSNNGLWCTGYSSGVGTAKYAMAAADAHAHVSMGAHVRLESASAASGNGLMFFCEGGIQHCALGFDATGHATVYGGANTLLATSPIAHSLTNWFHIEMEVVVHDTAGSITVKIDGVPELALTGIDTRNGGTGVIDNCFFYGTVNSNNYGFTIDNMYVTNGAGTGSDNTLMGQLKIENLFPSGDGASSQWVGSDGNSISNYQLVDDTSMTDYIDGVALGDTDLYALPDGTASLGAVVATMTLVLGQKSATGVAPGDLKIQQKSAGGTTTEDLLCAAANLTVSPVWYVGPPKLLDPNGDAWTDARMAGLQTGPKVG